MSTTGGPSRRGAFGVALLGLPFAGNLAGSGQDDEPANLDEAGADFRLEAARDDGSTLVAASPVRLAAVETALTDAGFRVRLHAAGKHRRASTEKEHRP
ncbi:hypothetical protein [Parafrankia sp. FMc2]|uniref:hypothetical protein n=1 Tax=Parafrankia sp. FMc2 TaxID=3233196 RepID=UPI0034D76CB0